MYAGTKTPYPVSVWQYTPPPPGFSPVFVNYVGRHGARFFTKAGSDVELLKVLQKAQQNKPNPRSPYIIPQRIACPKCGQVDQYTLAPQTLSSLMLSTLASGAFVFTGRGRGHGAGLCQWGAAGLAREGKTYREILKHYYPETEVVRMY
jgi:SpoIID/LytB domain protein